MYREPDRTPHCVSCGGAHVTPPTRFDLTEGAACVQYLIVGTTGVFGGTPEPYRVTRARVCLDCGHVMHGLDTRELERLRTRLQNLAPAPELHF
jgi:hypothetical protein